MDRFSQEGKMYELVTIEENLKCLPDRKVCKEFMTEESISIPCKKPKIDQISKIIIKPIITASKTISTIEGRKVIIQGEIFEKVFYVAKTPEQTVHCAKFRFSFCNFIKLPKKYRCTDIKVNIEDLILQLKGKKKINQCILLIICAVPKRKHC